MKIETWKVANLLPDPQNARKHDQRNLDAIKTSLDKFGQRKPIVITPEGVVLAGNGTLEAAKALGWSEITVALTPADWDYATAKAYALADNRSAELAEWDTSILASQLVELDAEGWDISELGFDVPEPTEIPQEDDTPLTFDDGVEPTTKLGDLYQLGDHRLLCGNSADPLNLDKLMGEEKAELVLTDPPYRYKTMGAGGAFDSGYKKLKDDIKDIIDFDPSDFLSVLPTLFNGNMNAYIFCNTDLVPDYCNWAREYGYNFNILTWHKTSFIPATNGHHFPDTEYLIYISKNATWNNGQDVNYGKYFVLNNEKHADHPTIKPQEILIDEIKISSAPKGIVVDLYGGSGSTLIACEQTNRQARLIELDPKYCDVIIKRWENLTGKKAELCK
jgi:site-specific DNA-methyltransferase (adenine-specific)